MSILTTIQSELKAPKGRYNSFGKYKYRSCEDILEAVKPLLAKHGATLVIRDEMVAVGDRIYVKATAAFAATGAMDEYTEVSAFAREPDSKKGMDESQITGTASSYARKYALNGLFLIDDTKDADTDEYTIQTKEAENDVATQKIGKVKAEALEKRLTDCGQDVNAFLKYYRVTTLADLTEQQHLSINRGLDKREG